MPACRYLTSKPVTAFESVCALHSFKGVFISCCTHLITAPWTLIDSIWCRPVWGTSYLVYELLIWSCVGWGLFSRIAGLATTNLCQCSFSCKWSHVWLNVWTVSALSPWGLPAGSKGKTLKVGPQLPLCPFRKVECTLSPLNLDGVVSKPLPAVILAPWNCPCPSSVRRLFLICQLTLFEMLWRLLKRLFQISSIQLTRNNFIQEINPTQATVECLTPPYFNDLLKGPKSAVHLTSRQTWWLL